MPHGCRLAIITPSTFRRKRVGVLILNTAAQPAVLALKTHRRARSKTALFVTHLTGVGGRAQHTSAARVFLRSLGPGALTPALSPRRLYARCLLFQRTDVRLFAHHVRSAGLSAKYRKESRRPPTASASASACRHAFGTSVPCPAARQLRMSSHKGFFPLHAFTMSKSPYWQKARCRRRTRPCHPTAQSRCPAGSSGLQRGRCRPTTESSPVNVARAPWNR